MRRASVRSANAASTTRHALSARTARLLQQLHHTAVRELRPRSSRFSARRTASASAEPVSFESPDRSSTALNSLSKPQSCVTAITSARPAATRSAGTTVEPAAAAEASRWLNRAPCRARSDGGALQQLPCSQLPRPQVSPSTAAPRQARRRPRSPAAQQPAAQAPAPAAPGTRARPERPCTEEVGRDQTPPHLVDVLERAFVDVLERADPAAYVNQTDRAVRSRRVRSRERAVRPTGGGVSPWNARREPARQRVGPNRLGRPPAEVMRMRSVRVQRDTRPWAAARSVV